MTRFELAVALVLAAVPLQAKPRALKPSADELILKMLAGPATSYVAVERVQVLLPGKKPKALKVNITAISERVRREVLPSRKKAASLVEIKVREKAGAGLARLRSIYEIAVSTGGVVAKRKTWKIALRLKSGTLRRALWVDRDSGLLMKRETYRDDGSLARRERLVKLDLPAAVDPATFASGPAVGPWVPDGFVFTGQSDGALHFSNGLEAYAVSPAGKTFAVSGDLAEDDAARVLEPVDK